jgi:hypothetical protein
VTFEQILLLYIYQHKKISLNLFGTIELEGIVPDPEVIRKEKHLAVEGLKFHFDPNVTTDEAFVHFYASEKGRIIPLSASDIDLHLSMAKQIVNIGNPFDIPGVGKIVKMDNGKLTMIPGFFTIPPLSGSGRPAVLRERVQAAPLPKGEREKIRETSTLNLKPAQLLAIIGTIAGVALIIWAIFKFIIPQMKGSQPEVDVANVATDTVPEITTPITPDTLQNISSINTVDSAALITWKAYIGQTNNKNFADERMNRYKGYGHNVILEAPDSNQFLIYIPIQSAIADTAKKRDSLSKFFAYPVKIERQTQ